MVNTGHKLRRRFNCLRASSLLNYGVGSLKSNHKLKKVCTLAIVFQQILTIAARNCMYSWGMLTIDMLSADFCFQLGVGEVICMDGKTKRNANRQCQCYIKFRRALHRHNNLIICEQTTLRGNEKCLEL